MTALEDDMDESTAEHSCTREPGSRKLRLHEHIGSVLDRIEVVPLAECSDVAL